MASVQHHPDAPAVTCGDVTLTFANLAERASRLARRLQREGVGIESRVGLCLERTADWPVAVLGVLLAGGAYVPIDTSLPEERIATKVEDSGLTVLVATAGAMRQHMVPAGARVVLLETVADPAGPLDVLPGMEAEASQLAYVIYTSGSTGRPKGVAIERGSLAFSTAARTARYGTRPTILGVYPFSFDSSIAGLFWCLTAGGHYVITPPGAERDPARLAALIAQHRITHLDCLPSHYAALLEFAGDDALRSVRHVIVGGEELTSAVWDRHRRRLPHVPLHNEYGPTEATVWCCVHHVGHPEHFGRVPIGLPLPGVVVRLEDAHGSPVAPGQSGELLVAGPGLARGYLNDDTLTRERFVWRDGADPAASPVRFYRTGDRVRVGEHGLLEFIGRLDRQVKVNGYRIELGDVEAALTSLPAVHHGVVRVVGDADARRLVAYVVLVAGGALTSTSMRRSLALHLPAHMIPSMLVVLPQLPLTPNGKVDYAALPDPSAPTTSGATQPRGAPVVAHPVEATLLAIWQRYLPGRDVQLDDNVFDLGGTSLHAIRAAAELQAALGRTVDPREFYYRPLSQVATSLRGAPLP